MEGIKNPFPLLVGQEHYLHLAGATLSPHHTAHKTLLNLPPSGGETGAGTTISIIDSGVEPGAVSPNATFNWVDDTAPQDATDRIGHGTGVAAIIADLAPDATLEIHKISDRPRISEWAVLAALAASSHADVVNMSLAFGLETRDCPTCGRQSHGARSHVFEICLEGVLDRNDRQIVVAAAGNNSADKLNYPARFGNVLAVCAATATGGPTGYTNHGTGNHHGGRHDGVFLAPGGDGSDHVVSTDIGGTVTGHTGTSFAAPYVSAMIALRRSGAGQGESRDQTLRYFGTNADTTVPGFSAKKYGNGLIRY